MTIRDAGCAGFTIFADESPREIVLGGDPLSRRRFGWYWMFVKPGSALIGLAMLRQVRRNALRLRSVP
jgi:hypothetical protein